MPWSYLLHHFDVWSTSQDEAPPSGLVRQVSDQNFDEILRCREGARAGLGNVGLLILHQDISTSGDLTHWVLQPLGPARVPGRQKQRLVHPPAPASVCSAGVLWPTQRPGRASAPGTRRRLGLASWSSELRASRADVGEAVLKGKAQIPKVIHQIWIGPKALQRR